MLLRSLVPVVAALLATTSLAGVVAAPPAAAATGTVVYAPPVDAAVVDEFRPPPSRYGAGNRGIDYDTGAGDPVHAAAAGVVVFAGRIGPSSHVVVLHDDGVRTSYSFLADVAVRRGQRLDQGATVGTTAGRLHFGARVGEEYVDPALLFGGEPTVRLVPADHRHPLAEWQERRSLVEGLAGWGGATLGRVAGAVTGAVTPVARMAAAAGWDLTERALLVSAQQWTRVDEAVRAWAHVGNLPLTHAERIRVRTERVTIDQRHCTPAGVSPPVAPGAGRIALLVAGLGSTGGGGAVLDVDTDALGYGEGMVAQFSYAGGQAPGDRTIAGVPVRDYGRRDTYGDLRVAGERLRRLLADLARRHPGVPVDLIAHSQGGIVVRAALAGADTFDPDLPLVANVVTLGSPHHGAVPATAANAVGLSDTGGAVYEATGRLGAPTGRSTQQLASSSHLVEELGARGLPAGTVVTSIAASGDLVVDAQMSAIDHATNVVVPLTGLAAHDRLPGHAETARELALALGGQGPSCRDLGPDLAVVDAVNLANSIRWVTDRAAALLAA